MRPAWWRVLGWSTRGGAGGRSLRSLRTEVEVGRLHFDTRNCPVTDQSVKLEVVICRVGQHDVGQARLQGDCWLAAGLAGGLGVAGLVTELVNLKQNILTALLLHPPGVSTYLVPEQTVGYELLRVGHLPADGALPSLVLNDPVPGALITGRARTARHHDSVTQQLLADRTQQLRGNVNLQSSS